MTEQELVKWYCKHLKEFFKQCVEECDDAETICDLDKMAKDMRRNSKELKGVIKYMQGYCYVQETIKGNP